MTFSSPSIRAHTFCSVDTFCCVVDWIAVSAKIVIPRLFAKFSFLSRIFKKLFLDLTRRHIRHIINLLQGEVQILTGGIVREHAMRADKVQFLDRRYSPDGRSDVFCISTYVCALEGAFFLCSFAKSKKSAPKEKNGQRSKEKQCFQSRAQRRRNKRQSHERGRKADFCKIQKSAFFNRIYHQNGDFDGDFFLVVRIREI